MGLSNVENDLKKGLFSFAIKEIKLIRDKSEDNLLSYACDRFIDLCNRENDTSERAVLLEYIRLKTEE